MMISGKISETSYDATSIQVVIVQSEEGEYLSLGDIKGNIFGHSIIASGDKQITYS